MSTTTTLTEPAEVTASLNYYLDPSKGGHTTYQIGVSDYYRRKFDPHPATIKNIRGHESDFKLDVHGFQHGKHGGSLSTNFYDDEEVKKVVYPETQRLLKDLLGATRVHVFSHITRKDSREEAEKAVNSDPSLQSGDAEIQKITPARFVHVDFSYDGALEILRDNFDPVLGEKLSKSRWGIINVWRPIKPVHKDPLAFCDARTAKDEDLMPVVSFLPPKGSGQYATVSGGERFELYYKRYDENEKWYYCERMMPDECLFLKIFDSKKDGVTARRVPHSAFEKPASPDDSKRESMEIRCLVFWEDQV